MSTPWDRDNAAEPEPAGPSYAEQSVLRCLEAKGPQTMEEIVAVGWPARRVGEILSDLAAAGYVRELKILNAPSQWVILRLPPGMVPAETK